MIEPINHYSIKNVPTVFDEEALTVLELVGRLTGKTNEIIHLLLKHDIDIGGLGTSIKNIDNHMTGIAETLGELVVEPLGFATPQMFGATGDGVADDTQAIKAAIQSLSNHNAVLYFPPGTYLVTEDIDLKSNITVKGSGEASVIRRAGNVLTHYRVFRCVNVSNVHICDLSIHGDKDQHMGSSGEWGMCVSLEGTRNVSIDRCWLMNGWGDGVYIGVADETGGPYCQHITIRDSKIVGNRRNGISVISVDGLTIDGCLISTTKGTLPEAGIDFEPNLADQVVKNVRISNTTFTGNANDVLFADTENNLYFTKQVIFTGCAFNSKSGLDWRTPLTQMDGSLNPESYVRFVGCEFRNSHRCVRVTKGDWDTLVTFSGCDFSCDSIAIEIGESGRDYNGGTLGGLCFLDCRVHANGSTNPVVRGVGSNASFAKITADLHADKAIRGYGYFSGANSDIHLDLHEGIYQVSVSTTFDKYKIPSTIYVPATATEGYMMTFDSSFPRGQVVRIIRDTTASVGVMNTNADSAVVPEGVSYFMLTPSGKVSVIGGIGQL